MESGKLDEELRRMSNLADTITPGAMILFNESFAATNEREGSTIARQVIDALVDSGMRVFFVTHLYDLAAHLYGDHTPTLFLRAERGDTGARSFKLLPGEPLSTSFGADVYDRVFSTADGQKCARGVITAPGRPDAVGDDQRYNVVAERRKAQRAGLAPFCGEQAAVPAQQRCGGDDPVRPQRPGPDAGQRDQDGTVAPADAEPRGGAAQDRDLMA